ncbi:MAG: nucleotidyltransferase family protein [Roseburia sp.]|nr:nucleotidyltransferase family protein [Roseburia sp.]MCM1431884.1 nucleotidyltransferase family protein [Muribaculaceae bacterium]
MKTVGIIAEYNPFHNGHRYQIEKVRKETGADYIVIAMSGDFLQRGTPAILDKHTRAKMALCAGADLVLELPVAYATGSAEYFAAGGISLLGATAVTDTVCYGVESHSPALLAELAAVLAHPSQKFEAYLASLIKKGRTYPQARQEALLAELPQYPKTGLSALLSTPNNLLSLEYEKAIINWNEKGLPPLQGLGILRVGDGYHESEIHSSCASATAIRRLLESTQGEISSVSGELAPLLPAHSLSLLTEAAESRLLLNADDFSGALYARLLSERTCGFTKYADCTEALSHRLCSHLQEFVSFSQFASLLKTREVTRTRINRVLTHILLGIQKEDCMQPVSYLRVLGFNRRAEPLLSEISKKASAPLLTKVADACHILSVHAMDALQKDIDAADLYRGIARIKSGKILGNEYNTPIIIP